MRVDVQIIGAKPDSEEYRCAVKLKNIFENELPQNAMGEILLHPNATMFGQTIKDIDLLMIGKLQNAFFPLLITDDKGNTSKENVEIEEFCTAIEIKSHDIFGIILEGTEFFVKYGNDKHSVTSQSNEQKISVMKFFKRAFNDQSPFISNLIWFTGAAQSDIRDLLRLGKSTMATNALGADFSLTELMQTLIWQRDPNYFRGHYHLTANIYGRDLSDFQGVLKRFKTAKNSMGELTRMKIEQITSRQINSTLDTVSTDTMLIYRGKAGTGKTIGLIRMAVNYVDERDARVLILTYNKALVSDMRRLFALAELPDMFQEKCVHIETIHKFFYLLLKCSLYQNGIAGNDYITNYDVYLNELYDFLSIDSDARTLIMDELRSNYSLCWDYCFIDEAQDCSSVERDILMKIFPCENIVIADGGVQFVRNNEGCDWMVAPKRKSIKLKNSLRQKNNIIKFVNTYLSELDQQNHYINENERLPGGRIIIADNNSIYELLKEEFEKLKISGNIAYDMLIFVPHTYVSNDEGFRYTREFEDHGLFIWDGTKKENRSEYPVFGDEIRLMQYESGRGLEGWTVVCFEFDTFLENKIRCYDPDDSIELLQLESAYDKKMRSITNWMTLPFTRAIDTLIITLKDPDSEVSQIIKKIAEEHPDIIINMEEQ